MTERWLHLLPDADAAARRAAEIIAGRLRAAVTAKGRFCLALSGGAAPVLMFETLAATALPWEQVEIYQVDERVAPAGTAQRNLTALQNAFRRTGAKIVAMPVDSDDLDRAAARYEAALPDVFDLVHLGLGPDGSTAALFPGDPVLDIADRDVALSGPHAGFASMTLTYRGMSKATEVLWLVTGVAKAAPLARLCAGDTGVPAIQVACLRTRYVTDFAAVDALETHTPKGVHLWHRNISQSSLTSTGR